MFYDCAEVLQSVMVHLRPKSCAYLGQTSKALRAAVDGQNYYWGRVAVHAMFRKFGNYREVDNVVCYEDDKPNIYYIRHVNWDRNTLMERYVRTAIDKIRNIQRREHAVHSDLVVRALVPGASMESILRAGEALRIMHYGRDELMYIHFDSDDWTFKTIAQAEYAFRYAHFVDEYTPMIHGEWMRVKAARNAFFDKFDALSGEFHDMDLTMNIIASELELDIHIHSDLLSVNGDEVVGDYYPGYTLDSMLGAGGIAIRRDALYNRIRLHLRRRGLPCVGRVMQLFRALFATMQHIHSVDYTYEDVLNFTHEMFSELLYGATIRAQAE